MACRELDEGLNGPGASTLRGRYREAMGWLLSIPPGAWFGIFGLIVVAGGIALYAATGEPAHRGLHTPYRPAPVRARHRFEDLHSPTIVVNAEHYRTRGRARVEDRDGGGPAPG